ncbi:unnamed protein product [Owenia fusiformis]|uniref:Rieske domain-containing protein n=1 Tax=Owenia fusiformis TaxID=6347 RepID=A0A8S4Q7S7_OWEFU|nr:unnamed protein product [Owenia fusiformis]
MGCSGSKSEGATSRATSAQGDSKQRNKDGNKSVASNPRSPEDNKKSLEGSSVDEPGYGQKVAPLDPLPPDDPGVPIEKVVCQFDDFKDGEMREVDIDGSKVLLVREHGEYHAIGARCTHVKAPLVKGVLCNGRVRCPWHGACFNIRTGDIEDFPGLDSLQKYTTVVEEGNVKVKTFDKLLKSKIRVKEMSCFSEMEEDLYLIIGGGPASVVCAETIRQEGFRGKVVIATKEPHLPYDRTKLSKAPDSTGSKLALREADFYKVYDIEVLSNKEAVSIDTMLNSATFADGDTINYNKLMIATGGRPKPLTVPGGDLENICLLRSPEDGNTIVEQSKGKNVVVVGTSFIGLEIAAYLSKKAKSVQVVGRSNVPFKHTLGDKVGAAMQKMHEERGVKFHFGAEVQECIGKDGKLSEVILTTNEKLSADVCIVGTGVLPSTVFLQDSGIEMNSRGHIIVDKYMRTNKDNVFAGGDIVEFPLFTSGDEPVNIGHYQMAHAHGRTAGLSMMEVDMELRSVPFFWTEQYGKSLRYSGYNGPGFDDVIIDGNLDELHFTAYYTKGDKVIAVASMGPDPMTGHAAEMFLAGKTIGKEECRDKEWTNRIQD